MLGKSVRHLADLTWVSVVVAGLFFLAPTHTGAQGPPKPPKGPPPCWPPPCVPDNYDLCKWSAWLNRDRPSGYGDYETRAELTAEGQLKCDRPLAVQCRYTNTGALWGTQTGNYSPTNIAGPGYRCETMTGGSCVNSQTTPKNSCKDSEVRFCCVQ